MHCSAVLCETIMKESCNFELGSPKKKKEEEEEKEKDEQEEERKKDFWFGTFAMLFRTRHVVGHKNT